MHSVLLSVVAAALNNNIENNNISFNLCIKYVLFSQEDFFCQDNCDGH